MEFNGDGKPVILSGCYSEHTHMAGLFWLLAGTGDGSVANPPGIGTLRTVAVDLERPEPVKVKYDPLLGEDAVKCSREIEINGFRSP